MALIRKRKGVVVRVRVKSEATVKGAEMPVSIFYPAKR
jgi:hypothetical protein